jgi:mono/diheme cytochrome c family protein
MVGKTRGQHEFLPGHADRRREKAARTGVLGRRGAGTRYANSAADRAQRLHSPLSDGPRVTRGKEDCMTITGSRYVVAAAALAAILGGSRLAAQTPPAQSAPAVKVQAAHGFVGISGSESYAAYCAACHGVGGKGNGPAAPALKMPVPDLTTLTKRHGTFDAIGIERSIVGADRRPAAHGDLTMPVWGPVFKSSGSDQAALLRAKNLVDYLKSIQEK